MKFPFYDSPDTATIICCHILERQAPILYVSHDEDDGMWQFLCGETHETDEANLVSLKWVFDLDNSVNTLKDMPCGYYAERKNKMTIGLSESDNLQFIGELNRTKNRYLEVDHDSYYRSRRLFNSDCIIISYSLWFSIRRVDNGRAI